MEKGRVFILILILACLIGVVVANIVIISQQLAILKIQPVLPLSGKEIVHGNLRKKEVMFTFDGGSGIESAEKILDILQKHHVVGTFFLTGEFIDHNPELTKKIHSLGNEIYNHTYNHPHLTLISDEQITKEFNRTEESLVKIIGITPKPYFRAPYGDRDARVLDVALANGYRSVYWTSDVLDWKEPEGVTASEVKELVMKGLRPGAIYLMHIGDNITGQILDSVFSEIESKGYNLVSLGQSKM